MHQCPKCRAEDIHRSRSRNRWENWRRSFTGKRTYRCHACGWRGWGPDLGPRFGEQRELTTPPAPRTNARHRPEAHPDALNLAQLDSLEAIGDERK